MVDYAELPAAVDVRAATAPGAPQLFEHIANNVVFDWDNDTSDFAATEAAFAGAAHVTTLEMINNRKLVIDDVHDNFLLGKRRQWERDILDYSLIHSRLIVA